MYKYNQTYEPIQLYCLWHRHMCVNNLPKVVTKRTRPGVEPATCWVASHYAAAGHTLDQRVLTMPAETSIFTRTLGPDQTTFEVCWVQPISGPDQVVNVKS